ncbi:MAG: CvpA family protein [Bacillota bacterium]|nr:CvpA family protein [Bacillota bacterium]
MNYTDFIVIAIIIAFAIIGTHNGFMLSVYRIASFFISIFLAVKLYPILSKLLQKTFIFTSIRNSIFNSLTKQSPGAGNQVKQVAADSVINNMHLPGFLKSTVSNSVSKTIDPGKLIDTSKVLHTISDALATVAVDVISLILLYVLVRVGMVFFKYVLKGISKLPVLKQIDKLGGFVLGGVEGLLAIYVVCAILTLFQASPGFRHIFESLDNSLIAGYFYQHNFIISWMFPAHKNL